MLKAFPDRYNGNEFSRRLYSLIFLLFAVNFSFAQQTRKQSDPDQQFKTGLELLERKDYGAARRVFEQYLSLGINEENVLQAEAEYYRAYCAINLFNDDGERLMSNFVKSHPLSPKAVRAYADIGDFFYRNKDYKKASEYFILADTGHLSGDQLNEIKFKLGYSYFNQRDTVASLKNFVHVAGSNNAYTSPAAYYAGFIELQRKNYKNALKYLEISARDDAYKDFVPSLIIQAYHDQGDYEKAIELGTTALENQKNVREKPNILMLIGDSYYMKGNYPKANQYFSDYFAMSPSAPGPDLTLKAGISAYHDGYYIDAAGYLKQVALLAGRNGQLASYYLGHSYIELDNKPYALTAFDAARKAVDDKKIQEEAMFYFGKLSFELGNFSDVVEAFSSYNANYPRSSHTVEVNDLLSEAYLRSENYDQALAYIESLSDHSPRIREVYQKVTYRKGTQLYNAGRYPEAIRMFQSSLKYPMDKETLLWTNFWMGETYSTGRKYAEAIQSYSGVFRSDPGGSSEQYLKARYGIGYAYFNTGAYDKALEHFKGYTDRLRREGRDYFYTDALLRLADCYYATREYNLAIAGYNAALKEGHREVDYCYYQLGLVSGIQADLPGSFRYLDMVIDRYPNSVYYDDALFQKAQITFEHGDYEPAIGRFNRLISEQPQSPYLPYALVSRAVASNNLKDYDATIKDYKQVIAEFPRHAVANSALLGLQEALGMLNRAAEFSEYMAMYKEANPGSGNLAGVEFESAKAMYYSENYAASIEMFLKFIDGYKQSPFEDEAYYYLGESYNKANNFSEAINAFRQVSGFENSKWRNRSIQRLAELNHKMGSFEAAIGNYNLLATLAGNRREEFNAWSGLMESYLKTGQYDSSIHFAGMILEKGSLTAGAVSAAHLCMGKAYLAKNDEGEAMDHFLTAVNTAKDEKGAEAQYLIATILRKQGNYLQSNETLYDLNENFSIYDRWVGNSFLLIADNFISLGEEFQAKATLNSIIDKSPDQEIVRQARGKLLEITEKESLPADSVK
ncbi:MAG TPA: tetratricopeptide repeat protein [Cyclobacteriaceae bacterium]|nr:tetratricopeptide repeat protein [Cyclobacteriaceae bacterium]